jgi:ribosomal protein S18 acetylase RimI-like enzyme
VTTTIRPVIPADRGRLSGIVRSQPNFLECEITIAMEVIDGSFDPAQDYKTLVAVEHSGWIAGFISFGPIPLTENRYDLYWIVVDPESGRQGVGTLLLAAMEDQLRQQGAGHIYIDTSSTEGYAKARAFYEKHDYHVACRLEAFYREGDDRIIYLKKF